MVIPHPFPVLDISNLLYFHYVINGNGVVLDKKRYIFTLGRTAKLDEDMARVEWLIIFALWWLHFQVKRCPRRAFARVLQIYMQTSNNLIIFLQPC